MGTSMVRGVGVVPRPISATRRRIVASKYRAPQLSQMPMGTSSRITNVFLWRSASRSTRRSRTTPSQCSQVKSYILDTLLYLINGNDQQLIVLNKMSDYTDRRFLVGGVANDNVLCATKIHRQHLIHIA